MNPFRRWCIWRGAVCSFRGHIQTLSSTGQAGVSLGPSLERNHHGRCQANARTIARRRYTEMLLATHPWADGQDLQIFLMGFDAGEQWAFCRRGTISETQSETDPSWLAAVERQSVPVPIRAEQIEESIV